MSADTRHHPPPPRSLPPPTSHTTPLPGSPPASQQPEPGSAPWIVPVSLLTAHPGNVREDLDLTPEFCASVAEFGVRVPLLVAPDGRRTG